jgi:hypothetical protein
MVPHLAEPRQWSPLLWIDSNPLLPPSDRLHLCLASTPWEWECSSPS